jgi:hypothetical protein
VKKDEMDKVYGIHGRKKKMPSGFGFGNLKD